MDLDGFLSKLDGVRAHAGGQFEALCPSHEDHSPSLSIREGDHGGIVLKCHAGCETKSIVESLGLSMADLAGEPYVVETYDYIDEGGVMRYQVQRWHPKTFRCVPGLPAIAQRIPYNIPWIQWARTNGQPVYVVEGERDCNTLAKLGVAATCNPTGAGHWLAHYSDYLRGLDVIVVADVDAKGYAHARDVAASVKHTARSVVTCKPRYGKDVTDLIAAGFGIDTLDPLTDDDNTLGFVRANNIRTKSVTWAWDGFMPFGKITIIEGDPGDGKSLLAVDLAARWSSGAPLPDGTRLHGGGVGVLFISAEDSPDDTIVPRLRAAGADLSRVHVTSHGATPDQPFNLSTDTAGLYGLVMEHSVRVVIVDPLSAMLDEKTDSHNDASTRRGLYPLFALARDTGVAVVAIRHLNKGVGGKAIYRGGGSIAFIGLARAAYSVGRNPDDPNQRIFACVKNNLAAEPASLAYTIEHNDAGSYLKWHGVVAISAQNIVDGESREDLDEASEFLNYVVENGQPMTWQDIVKKGKAEGFSERTLRRRRSASRLLKIVGGDGNRSIKWGYLEHKIAQDDTSRDVTEPDSHSATEPHLALGQALGQVGLAGQVAAQDRHAPLPNPDLDASIWDADELRDAELDAAPDVCDYCGVTIGTRKYHKPWWVVRCRAHSPLTFHEKGSADAVGGIGTDDGDPDV